MITINHITSIMAVVAIIVGSWSLALIAANDTSKKTPVAKEVNISDSTRKKAPSPS